MFNLNRGSIVFVLVTFFLNHPLASAIEGTHGIAVDEAIRAAGIEKTDTLALKVQKTLKLLNQEHYYYPQVFPGKLAAPYTKPYDLDSQRTPEQILTQKAGGYCESAALVFSAMMERLGVKPEDLRVVAGVNAPDLEIVCPVARRPRVEHPDTGASGHVFVALKFPNGEWRLINTIDGSHYESISWKTPEELASQMANGPVQIPFSMYKNFPRKLRSVPMVVFRSWKLAQVPLHTFEQRFDLIASGDLAQPECRYGSAEMRKLKKQ